MKFSIVSAVLVFFITSSFAAPVSELFEVTQKKGTYPFAEVNSIDTSMDKRFSIPGFRRSRSPSGSPTSSDATPPKPPRQPGERTRRFVNFVHGAAAAANDGIQVAHGIVDLVHHIKSTQNGVTYVSAPGSGAPSYTGSGTEPIYQVADVGDVKEGQSDNQ